MVTQPQMEQ
jgi:hypothetical protein